VPRYCAGHLYFACSPFSALLFVPESNVDGQVACAKGYGSLLITIQKDVQRLAYILLITNRAGLRVGTCQSACTQLGRA